MTRARTATCGVATLVLLLTVAACADEVVRGARAGTKVASWVTMPDRSQLLARQLDVPLRGETVQRDTIGAGAGATTTAATAATRAIDIDTTRSYQEIVGFGAALTDASAWLLQHRLAPAQRDALLRELFSRERGIGLGMLRVTIGASDFSRSHYTFDDIPPTARDDSLAHFSIAPHRRDVIPLLTQARALNPQLWVMATPWSAPAWMKSNRSLVRGTLRRDAYPAYAEYLTRFVEEYERAGVPVQLLSVQNEPRNEPSDYPGMRFDAPQRAEFVGKHLGPLFARRGVRTRLLDWDHNWDAPESPLGVLGDSLARRYVTGVAWHCYAGDVAAQSQVHDAYPEKDAWFTECSGGRWAPNFGDNLRWNTRTLVIGATRHWARGVMLWNLALDERHGPHAGGCNDCRGVVTIDSATGTVTRNEEYYALAHAARFVHPGARRIASTGGGEDVATVAFRNPDGGLVLVAVNSAPAARRLALRAHGWTATLQLPAGAVATYTWRLDSTS